MKKKFNLSLWLLVLAIAFYFAGVIFIPKTSIETLKMHELAEQEDYIYEDNDGEEHEGLSLIRIDGLGKVFIYEDIYFMSVWMVIIAMFFGSIILGEGSNTESNESLKHITLANCVLGVLLIRLTTKDYILPTIFFWLGIIAAWITSMINNKSDKPLSVHKNSTL